MPAHNSEKKASDFRYQQALRLASRGPDAVWLHLLLPLTLLIGATLFVGVPMLVANFAPPLASKLAVIYLDWCAPVFIVSALTFQHWARKRLLAPYLEQVSRGEATVSIHES